ncbi:MAG: peptidoglycan editing factor PgeF [Ardenticatenia bacterium]|nr:MAG: peptidoglycan editing factor PgeF [Ardenticatenia bacterium]
MSLERVLLGEIPAYRFTRLTRVRHAIFTRHGGVSQPPFDTLNVSWAVGDDEAAVRENVRRLYAALGADAARAVRVRMVHGTRVALVSAADAGKRLPDTDGLITAERGLPLAMTFGDCQPLVLYDPEHHAVGLAHAGWRGTLGGIAFSLVRAMQVAFGARPERLQAFLGPAIGVCCYEVGENVARAARTWPGGDAWLHERDGRLFFDLSAANRALFQRMGVEVIEEAGLCTACRTDEFFSYRREKPATGRFGVIVELS